MKLPLLRDRFRLITSKIEELSNHIERETIDWIITDPPYPREYLPTFSDLSMLANKILRADGGLVVMSGQSYLPEVMARLSEHMEYHWTCAYLTPGGQSAYNFARKINPFWKPVFVFKRKGGSLTSFGDVIKTSANNNDKNFHSWGQSTQGFDDLVKRFSLKGQTILDPFLGGGTTGISALRHDRLFVGSDHLQNCIDISAKRINLLLNDMEHLQWLTETPMESPQNAPDIATIP